MAGAFYRLASFATRCKIDSGEQENKSEALQKRKSFAKNKPGQCRTAHGFAK